MRTSRVRRGSPVASAAFGGISGVVADEGVAGVLGGLTTEWQDVEVAAIRQLDLEQPGRPRERRGPAIDEPDEALDAGGQRDAIARGQDHGGGRAGVG